LFITRFLVSGLPKLRIGPTTQQLFNKVVGRRLLRSLGLYECALQKL